jgi:hypothetical protein
MINQFRITTDGNRMQKKSVSGWDLEDVLKDGKMSWIPL